MSALAAFLLSHRAEMAARLGEHVVLVAVSTLIAAAIAIPAGIVAARRPALGRPLVGLASLAQTIPSLALFGFLIPLPVLGGIGTRTALVALTVYAVLPIVRTTVAGLQAIDRAVIDCAVAMGMTPGQLLRRVELPLAFPSILAGVRVAAVVGVGTATIASAIGAGGLGDYIFRGLAMVDPVVILAGALPAALLALVADGALAVVGRLADQRQRAGRRRALAVLAAVLAPVAAVAAWLGAPGVRADVVVGSKNFTEQILLGEIVAQTLESRTELRVERRLNLGGTLVCDTALRAGDIDVYVEYTGTALTAIHRDEVGGDAASVFARVRERYADDGLTLLPRLGFNNTFAILVRRDQARALGLTRVSDLAAHAAQLTAGFGYEFLERPDGFAGLSRAYGLSFRTAPRVMDLTLIYRALAAGEIDVTAGDATSGLLEALGLVHLEDDRGYFPPYDAAPVARAATLLRHPEVNEALRWLEGRISAEAMRRMNHAVDGLRRDPAAVAREFLNGL
ncbi:MAG: ABC transporter permease/substrate-binding protein [Acidobacteriota bacterium]